MEAIPINTPHPIIALWCVPRSISTAFERMIAARGDFTVINEPFSRGYYFGPNRVSKRYPAEPACPEHDPHHMRAQVLEASQAGPVFFKDMAYHVDRFLDWEFIKPFRNAILIRDPRHSVVSLYKKMPDFTREETGFDALLRAAELITENAPSPPHIVDGEALRADPEDVAKRFCAAVDIPFNPQSLQWESGAEEHWDRWKEWFQEAANSTQFRAPAGEFDDATLSDPIVAEAISYCAPIYESLSERAPH